MYDYVGVVAYYDRDSKLQTNHTNPSFLSQSPPFHTKLNSRPLSDSLHTSSRPLKSEHTKVRSNHLLVLLVVQNTSRERCVFFVKILYHENCKNPLEILPLGKFFNVLSRHALAGSLLRYRISILLNRFVRHTWYKIPAIPKC